MYSKAGSAVNGSVTTTMKRSMPHWLQRHWRLAGSIGLAIGLSLGGTAILAQEVVAPDLDAGVALLTGAPPTPFPTLSAAQIDRQLELYLRYLAQHGRPDVLIIGSSRALQGVDPTALQASLAAAGYPRLKVFNFGINGATAQVEHLLMSRLLKPEQWPRVIVWADGVRAFNSGRQDLTYRKIQDSPGFQELAAGHSPQWVPYENYASHQPGGLAADPRQLQGFQIVSAVFVPEQYFQRFPKIAGSYDRDYVDFDLDGAQAQATAALIQATRQRRIPLVFVNLPLTDIYLDADRDRHEQAFRQSNRHLAELGQLTFIDLSQQWPDRYEYFADPSHINEHGAKAVGEVLGTQLAVYFEQRLGLEKPRYQVARQR
jgi:hypothetical protein